MATERLQGSLRACPDNRSGILLVRGRAKGVGRGAGKGRLRHMRREKQQRATPGAERGSARPTWRG
eukprot:8461509-Pyramimonas_sp.AAC.1